MLLLAAAAVLTLSSLIDCSSGPDNFLFCLAFGFPNCRKLCVLLLARAATEEGGFSRILCFGSSESDPSSCLDVSTDTVDFLLLAGEDVPVSVCLLEPSVLAGVWERRKLADLV